MSKPSVSGGNFRQSKQSQRIVIANHAATVREALRWLLDNEHDFDVIGEATNSVETVSCVLSLAPDLVIVDIDLPHVGGYTIARMLKQLPQPPLIALLAITNDGQLQAPPSKITTSHKEAIDYDGIIRQGADWPSIVTQIRALLIRQNPEDQQE